MKRSFASSSALALLCALSPAQYSKLGDGSLTGVSASGQYRQVDSGGSRLLDAHGDLVRSNVGYATGRGVNDDGYQVVVDNSNAAWGVIGSTEDPLGFDGYAADAGSFAGNGSVVMRWSDDNLVAHSAVDRRDGAGPAEVWSAQLPYGLAVTGVGANSLVGYGVDAGFNRVGFVINAGGLSLLGSGYGSTLDTLLMGDGGLVSATAYDPGIGADVTQFWDTASSLDASAFSFAANGVTGFVGGKAYAFDDGHLWEVAFDQGASAFSRTEVLDGGVPIAGITAAWYAGSEVFLNRSLSGPEWGSVSVAPVPEPASVLALGLGVAALSRRRRSS